MIITVTQEDIDKGRRRSCSACPVALAASRAAGWAVTVGNGCLSYYLTNDAGITKFLFCTLPQIAIDFIALFDSGGVKVEPFSFEAKPV